MASAGDIRAGKAYVEIFANDSRFMQSMTRIRTTMRDVGQQLRRAGTGAFMGGAAAAAPIALAVRQFALFDDAVRATAAAAGKGEGDLGRMRAAAEKLALQFGMTSTEVASLGVEVARAFGDKLNPSQIEDVTKAVVAMSKATGTDGVTAAQILNESLAQLQLGADGAMRVADVLTFTANATNTDVRGLGEALSYVGKTAADAGMDLEQTVAVLGTLGNLGLKGTEAGTAMRRLLTITGAEAGKLRDIFGVSFLDQAGNIRPLVDTLSEVAAAVNKLPGGERMAKMNDAFGLLGINAAAGVGQTAAATRELEGRLRAAAGTATQQAQFMAAGVSGSMSRMRESFNQVGNAFAEALAPAIGDVGRGLVGLLQAVRTMIQANPELATSITKVTVALVAGGAAAIGMGAAIGGLATTIGVLQKALTSMAAAATAATAAATASGAAAGAAQAAAAAGAPAAAGKSAIAILPLVSKFLASVGVAAAGALVGMKLFEGITRAIASAFDDVNKKGFSFADQIRASADAIGGLRSEFALLKKAMNEAKFDGNNVSDRELRALMVSTTGPESLRKLQKEQQDAIVAAGEEFPVELPDVPMRMREIASKEIASINANPRIFDDERERRVKGLQAIIARLDAQIREREQQAAATAAEAARAAAAPIPVGPTQAQLQSAEQVRLENRTPQEKLNDERNKLLDLLNAKALDEPTFLKAIAKAEADAADEIAKANSEAVRQYKDIADQIRSIQDDVATPAEKLADRISELRKLPLAAETFARAVEKAKADAASAMLPRESERPGLTTAGTFGDASMIGIGPELVDPSRETAENTRRMVDQLAALAMAKPAIPPAAQAPQVNVQPPIVPGIDVIPPVAPAAIAIQAPLAMAAEVAAPRAAEVRQAADFGEQIATQTATLTQAVQSAGTRIVEAVDRTTAAIFKAAAVLQEIADNTSDMGAVFQ